MTECFFGCWGMDDEFPRARELWIPAFAGMTDGGELWIPAFAGMTDGGGGFPPSRE